ncbi:MAG: Asp-tRNA(Asn)/Glu-tRNA(Gln) amidotransferase subunit GatC [Alphaproteobacteria bacterium]
MALDTATVARIARLARIRVGAEELDSLRGELQQIITWVEQLAEVATDDVAPMTSVAAMALPQRDDTVSDGGYADRILKNAPDKVGEFFTVPKVVE